jgi:hypothetical protein
MLAAVEKAKQSADWKKDGGQHQVRTCPHLADSPPFFEMLATVFLAVSWCVINALDKP